MFCQQLFVVFRRSTMTRMDASKELSEFSDRLNEICDLMGVPPKQKGRQGWLSKKFSVSQNGARKWLEAESYPSWENIVRLATWADVSVDWLMTGRPPRRLKELYETEAIAQVVEAMQIMDAQQQYQCQRLISIIGDKPEDPS
jgi:transcriptional regulator with XRE-family HTH domain